MKKVVYISNQPLTGRVEKYWFISHLINNSVTVEYWDITGLYCKNFALPDMLDRAYIVKPGNYGELENLIKQNNNENTNYVLLMNYEAHLYRLFRLLTRYNCNLNFFEWGNFPTRGENKWVRLSRLLRKPSGFCKVLQNRFIVSLSRSLGLVKTYDAVFFAGNASAEMHANIKKMIPVNLPNYDDFKEVHSFDLGKPYALFIDVCLPYHPDVVLNGIQTVTPERYYRSLNTYFNMIENKYGLPVIVAAHPKSNYSEVNPYDGRSVIRDRTGELTAGASLVLTHYSTALSYAILSHKQLSFIYTSDMAKVFGRTIVKDMYDFADYLNASIVNVDMIHSEKDLHIKPVDKERYDRYKYDFIVTEESEKVDSKHVFLSKMVS